MNNPYWDNITEIAEHQRKKGIAEYGQAEQDERRKRLRGECGNEE